MIACDDDMSEGRYEELEAMCAAAGRESFEKSKPRRKWEYAVSLLDVGILVRRRAWAKSAFLDKGTDNFIYLESKKGRTRWNPWLEDFFADDWEMVQRTTQTQRKSQNETR